MLARQIAALLKSNRQDGWTYNNNNRNAHQVHNNNVINTTMYPEQQLSAGSIGQNVQPAQFTNNININVAFAKDTPIGVDTEEDFLAIKKIMDYKSQ